jgi:bifunctional non-homologous end joining protein LigD
MLDEVGLHSFPKTSGSKGLQMYAPLNTKVSFEDTGSFAHALAKEVEKQHPDQVVSKMAKDLRVGKVLIDWSQNDGHKTTASVYSLRAMKTPSVSTPLEWKEVESALKKDNAESLFFGPKDVLRRVDRKGDIFEPVRKLRQKLPRWDAEE